MKHKNVSVLLIIIGLTVVSLCIDTGCSSSGSNFSGPGFDSTGNSSNGHGLFAGGDGSKKSPYQVSTIDQLQSVNLFPNSHFIQVADINASSTKNWHGGKGFMPIGNSRSNPFSGTYDGHGFTISHLTMKRDSKSNRRVGLFGVISDEAVLENIKLTDVSITGAVIVGGIVAINQGKIKRAYVEGMIKGTKYVGGIVGFNGTKGDYKHAIISQSHSDINALATGNDLGGISGYNYGQITMSYSEGVIIGEGHGVGGISGVNKGGEIEQSYSKAKISDSKWYLGGIVGLTGGGGKISETYVVGPIGGTKVGAGGIAGEIGKGSENIVQYSYWDKQTTNQTKGIGANKSSSSQDQSKGLSSFQMKGIAAKNYMRGFDFTNVWETVKGDYPILKWQNE